MDYDDDDPRNWKNLEKKFTQSAAKVIQTKGAKRTDDPLGTGSFQEGLSETPDLTRLGLTSNVTGFGRDDVKPVAKGRFKVMFSTDGRILTHDGAYPIDSNGEKCRYVILLEADGAYLYTDQCISEGIGVAAQDVFNNYPTLDSHGQIDGHVIGAGDMIVDQGQVIYLDSQSGSFHPTGANLAATLKLFVRTGLITEEQIVTGGVTVAQFIAAGGFDVDEGDLVNLLGAAMAGQLRSKTGAPTRTTPARAQQSQSDSEESDEPEKGDRDKPGEGGGDPGIFNFEDF
jgi:hypothetical protein